jgi:kynurenine formamidase
MVGGDAHAGVDSPGAYGCGVDELPLLCGAGAVIAENLTGLDRLLQAQAAGLLIEFSLFPIPPAEADGAPVRAVARIGR